MQFNCVTSQRQRKSYRPATWLYEAIRDWDSSEHCHEKKNSVLEHYTNSAEYGDESFAFYKLFY